MLCHMKKYFAAALLLLSIAGSSIGAETETFARYLQKGDSGSDVRSLQKILNTDPETQVAAIDSGSKGQETEFFGEMTKQGVIKLQKKHELGTKYGFFTIYSGALDDKTRAFLNKLAKEQELAADPCDRDLDLSTASSLIAFQDKLNEQKDKLKPENTNIEEKWGALNELYRLSEARSSSAPYISKIEISAENEDDDDSFLPFSSAMTFKSGDVMKITGCNFATSTQNTIRMTYGTEKATSTDGTLITLKPQSTIQQMFDKQVGNMKDKDKDSTIGRMPNIPLFVIVENDKGTSNPYQIYTTIR